MLIRYQAFSLMYSISLWHVQSFGLCKRRCLWEVTSVYCWLCIKIGGWTGALTFGDIRKDSLLEGLNVTSHTLAHLAIVSGYMFSNCAVTSGCSKIRYKLVSSNGCHYGVIFLKPEKNLEFFRLKNDPIDDYPGRLEWLAVNNLVYFWG